MANGFGEGNSLYELYQKMQGQGMNLFNLPSQFMGESLSSIGSLLAGAGGGGWNPPSNLPPLDSAGGGGYVVPWAQTQAGVGEAGRQALEQIRLSAQLDAESDKALAQMQIDAAKELEKLRQKGALSLEEMRQKFQLEQIMKQISFEREALYVKYKGQDPVRAVMLGMGMLGEGEGGKKYAGLPKIKGAAKFEKQTESALGGIFGKPIDITAKGVGGLPSVQKAATSYQRGGEDIRTLLGSAFGVGHEGIGGGMSQQEVQRRIQEVTPTGVL